MGGFFWINNINICSYIIDFIIAVVATGIGVYAAFWLERKLAHKREQNETKKENARLKKRTIDLLIQIKKTLNSNLQLITAFKNDISMVSTIIINVDITPLNLLTPQMYELIQNLELFDKVDHIRYVLLDIYNRMERLQDMEFSTTSQLPTYTDMKKKNIGATIVTMDQLIKETGDALTTIDFELANLSRLI